MAVSVRLLVEPRLLQVLPLQTASVCSPTDGGLQPLQTNPCRGYIKDKTCSALTGLDNWLPEPRAQRAREPPFVREAAP